MISFTGQNGIHKRRRPKQMMQRVEKCDTIGTSNVMEVNVEGRKCTALIDTGSMITTISEGFLKKVPDVEIRDLETALQIKGAAGQVVPYIGIVEVLIRINEQAMMVPVLVVHDTEYNKNVPLIIGTNILEKMDKNNIDSLSKPIKDAMESLVEKEIEISTLSQITIVPGKNVIIKGKLKQNGKFTEGIIKPSENIPGGILMPAIAVTAHEMEVDICMKNIANKSISIPKGQTIAHLVNYVILDSKSKANIMNINIQNSTASKDVPVNLDNTELTETQKIHVRELCKKYSDVFAQSTVELGKAKGIKQKINLSDNQPFQQRARRIPPSMYDEVRKHINEMLACGAIRHSKSPWSSNVVFARKKDGSLRLCLDFRQLNSKTIRDAYMLPLIENTLNRLAGAKYFTCLDLQSGYWQVELEEEDKQKTAFRVDGIGFFECNRMPFGLTNAPAVFQRMMEQTLAELSNVLVYIDDIVIHSPSFEQHLEDLEQCFQRLQVAGLKLKPSKCYLFQKEIKYLGHIISEKGIRTDPDKCSAVENWEVPTNTHELRQILGFFSYYRRFMKDFAKIAKPLNDLLKDNVSKKAPITMTEEAIEAFKTLKRSLTTTPILAYADYSIPFELHTDASALGLGAVLYQKQDGRLRVIAYGSRGLKPSEKHYPAHKLEFLALKWAVTQKFRDYLYGSKFVVMTDNNPLSYVLSTAKLDATGHRWLAELSNFDFSIQYRSGALNGDADALSRKPKQLETDMVKEICNAAAMEEHGITSASINVEEVMCQEEQLVVNHRTKQHDWKKIQHDDNILRELVELVEKAQKPSRREQRKLAEKSKDFRIYISQWNRLCLRDGVLYRKRMTDEGEVYQLVLPTTERPRALEGLHDQHGHLGQAKTLELVRSRFFWPRMSEEVNEKIHKCLPCVKRKRNIPDKAPLVNIKTCEPYELVCIDYLTLEPSKGGIENVLVVTDHFTRYAQAVPTRNQTARTTAEALLGIFNTYGIPKRLHSDQGRNFESAVIKEMCNLLGIWKSRTTPYHPMGNGQCERFNSTLMNMIGTLEEEQKANWKKYVPTLVHAYNCTKNESTGYSPFYLMFGRQARLPIDVAMGVEPGGRHKEHQSTTAYAKDLKERLDQAYKIASKEGEKSGKRNKQQYDKKVKGNTIDVGDRVLVRKVGFQSKHKLANRWEDEIYEVIKQPDESIPVFVVKGHEQGKKRTLHRNMLLPIDYILSEETAEIEKPDEKKRHEEAEEEASEDESELFLHLSESEDADSDDDEDNESVEETMMVLRPRKPQKEGLNPEPEPLPRTPLPDQNISPGSPYRARTPELRVTQGTPVHEPESPGIENMPETIETPPVDRETPEPPAPSPAILNRPQRNRRPPQRYADGMMHQLVFNPEAILQKYNEGFLNLMTQMNS